MSIVNLDVWAEGLEQVPLVQPSPIASSSSILSCMSIRFKLGVRHPRIATLPLTQHAEVRPNSNEQATLPKHLANQEALCHHHDEMEQQWIHEWLQEAQVWFERKLPNVVDPCIQAP